MTTICKGASHTAVIDVPPGSSQVKEAKPEGQEAKVSKPKKVKVGSDLVETPLPTADFQAAAGALQEVKLDTEYTYAPGVSYLSDKSNHQILSGVGKSV